LGKVSEDISGWGGQKKIFFKSISRKIISVDDIRNKKIRQQLEVDIFFSTELWKALEIVRERDYLWARRAYGHALQN
jgi:hypothetical protein